MENKYISDIIKGKDIKSWSNGDIITIKAGTGAGKSHFVKHDLYDYAAKHDKKILMLVSRRQIIDNFEKEVENKPNIKIDTYQKIEQSIVHKQGYDLSVYDYIVCDEFHYFLSDDFNKWIDLSFDKIMGSRNNVKLFMSATGDSVEKYFNEKYINTINYGLPLNFDRIKNLRFFYNDKTIEGFIQKAIDNNQKAIFFIESAEKAVELHRKYPKHTMFNCSSSNDKYYKYVDKKKVENMLETNRFDDLILITTRVMDTGVNIVDDDLQHIVIDVIDSSNIIQCIGRKRFIDNDDYVNVYIKSRNKKSIERFRRNTMRIKEKLDMLDFNGDYTYLEEHYRDDIDSNYIYTEWDEDEKRVIHKINKLNHFKNDLDIKEYENMKEYGYNYYISRMLGKDNDYLVVEEEQEKKALRIYLDSVIGHKLYKEDQGELKEVFKANGLKARTLGINTLNGYLKDKEMSYVIEVGDRKSYRDSDNKVRKEKSHWVIGKTIYSLK